VKKEIFERPEPSNLVLYNCSSHVQRCVLNVQTRLPGHSDVSGVARLGAGIIMLRPPNESVDTSDQCAAT
jgi:hypothetical protein